MTTLLVDSAVAEAIQLTPELAGPRPKGALGRVQRLVLAWVAGALYAQPWADEVSGRVLRSLEERGLVCCVWQGVVRSEGRWEATASHWALTSVGEALLTLLLQIGKVPSGPVPFPHRESAAYQIVARHDGLRWQYGAFCEVCRGDVESWHPTPYAADMAAWFEGSWSLEHGCPACQRYVVPVESETPRYRGEPLQGPRDGAYAADCWLVALQDYDLAWAEAFERASEPRPPEAPETPAAEVGRAA